MANPLVHKRRVDGGADFERILNLPRRVVSEADAEVLVERMTALLKTPNGTQRFKPAQAQALHELMTLCPTNINGVFCPMGVGTGKTFVTLLAATVLNARRPVLLLPASLVDKTERDRREAMVNWKVSTATQIESYQTLGRESGERWLELKNPDLLILDEGHKAKNLLAAVTRRIKRHKEAHPETLVIVLSGTVIKDKLKDFYHLIQWCLGEKNAPVPRSAGELRDWGDALDEKVSSFKRPHPGALLRLAHPEDIEPGDDLTTARRAFRRRLRETPGVIVSLNSEKIECSLLVTAKEFSVNASTEENFRRLRDVAELPDGWSLSEAKEVAMYAKQLALGFHYIWDPRPPEEWLTARRYWAKFVRDTIRSSDTLDSEKVVRNAVVAGELEDTITVEDPETGEKKEERNLLARWQDIEPTFRVNQKAVWHDTAALDTCVKWLHEEKGIAWTEHVLFGRELAKRAGVPYFGQKGFDALGRQIDDPNNGVTGAIVASIAANGTGKNLQFKWSRNLITSWNGGAQALEQLLGRTHRQHQWADEVSAEMLLGCREHVRAFEQAIAEAHMSEDMLGAPQRLLYGDVIVPTLEDIERRPGSRWSKNRQVKEDSSNT